MIKITCNGEVQSVKAGLKLAEVLSVLGYQHASSDKGLAGSFAVAVNNSFVPRSNYNNLTVHAEDQLDIIAPMQGG